ncbi:TolC family protein [Flavobacterium sp. W21_SRS_FM6]|uniref:TolC family protein n=1 Tax=Flavobacterium sp. W21_SRS_FM6 TaxID=3240268 RepID=UPI003F936CD8
MTFYQYLALSSAVLMSFFSQAQQALSTKVDLKQALLATYSRHPALMGKAAQIEAKKYLLESAEAQRYPSLSVSYGYDNADNDQGTFVAKQPIWAFGRIDSAINYAKTDVTVEYADRVRLLRQLMGDTASAYARVLGVGKQLTITRNNIAQHEDLLAQVQRREKGQLASEADSRLANSRLTQAKAQAIRLEGDFREAMLKLQTLTQLPINDIEPMDQQFIALPETPRILATIIDNSADIKYKESLVALAQKDVKRKRANYMPTLFIKLEHDYSDTSIYADDTRVSLMVEGGLDGLGLITRRQEQASTAQLHAAQRDVQVTRFELENQVNTYLSNQKIQQTLSESYQSAIVELTETLASYQRQYRSGRKAWMDILNIQREMTEQFLAQAQAESELLIIQLKLAALIGMLDIYPASHAPARYPD